MKRLLIAAILLLSGCRSETEYGPCIGVDGEKNPKLVYEPSMRNAILGVVFVEMIVPPIIWLTSEYECPIAVRVTP